MKIAQGTDEENNFLEKVEIIFEDEEVMVINKPFGMLVHEDWQSGSEGTVTEWFLERCPEARGVGEDSEKPDGTKLERSGIVHRLDRDTSGVMILAKTKAAHAFLKSQFHDRLVRKEYRAFVYGRMRDRWGTINRPIGRKAGDIKRRSAERGAKGVLREAVTHFENIGSGEYKNEAFSYLKLLPKTGRTHQIRVHLRAIGRPIVGDVLYAEKEMIDSNNLDFKRMALHSYRLEIEIPSGKTEKFVALLPQEFDLAAERIA